METMPSPVQQIHDPLFTEKGVEIYIKREDLNHRVISGNKWRKLKFNLAAAKAQQHETLLTFGGAYSNHIHAVAGAGKAYGFNTVGIIRGEETLPLNPTLAYAKSCGMKFHYLDRATYRLKTTLQVKYYLQNIFNRFYLIPEGGTNNLAIQGCEEIVTELEESYDYYCLSVGTGGTVSGVVSALKGQHSVIGFSALKGDFLTLEVEKFLQAYSDDKFTNWFINNDYHFGGYAKVKPELLDFMKAFEGKHKILLDPIYTAKSFYGLYDLIHNDHFSRGSRILFVHTGGLQGRAGFDL